MGKIVSKDYVSGSRSTYRGSTVYKQNKCEALYDPNSRLYRILAFNQGEDLLGRIKRVPQPEVPQFFTSEMVNEIRRSEDSILFLRTEYRMFC